ncbi:hypothetical protein HYZ99_00375 [Candidatus Peregrinibacteria bacterium]|nr:hypothetical protein [Candidatus Peregrinibacteria bacterium]
MNMKYVTGLIGGMVFVFTLASALDSSGQVAPSGAMTIDNSDPGFSVVGPAWKDKEYAGAVNDNVKRRAAKNRYEESRAPRWRFENIPGGKIYIEASMPMKLLPHTGNYRYVIVNGNTEIGRFPLIQTADASLWHALGSVRVVQGAVEVRLVLEGTTGPTVAIADAIRITVTQTCGNGICEANEGPYGCDPFISEDGTNGCEGYVYCPQDCEASMCGNGEMEIGEQCDDGNAENGDGCTARCELCPIPKCVAPPEGCQYEEDGTLLENGCRANPCGTLVCQTCGNGTIDQGEECDARDGSCDANCRFCPIPVCPAPPEGCYYKQDGTLGENGCYANPCGTLVCQ